MSAPIPGSVEQRRRRTDARTEQRLIALFLFGIVAFGYPLLEMFSARAALFGVPLVYAYLFAAWAGLIALVAWVVAHD